LAWDFGLILDQTAGYGGYESAGHFDYKGSFVPRISGLMGNNADFYFSAGIEADYYEEWTFVPELLRTEFSIHSGGFDFTFGRMYHSDPLGYIAAGLFDGAKLSYESKAGTLSAGAWYTGLLYKNRAEIEMKPEERDSKKIKPEFGDFANTYFAPRRFVSTLDWEHTSLGGGIFGAQFTLLGQFDLSGADTLHSQYAVGKFTAISGIFSFGLGGCLELIQYNDKLNTALAAEFEIALAPPTRVKNRLSLLGRFASGRAGETDAFLPLTTVSQGNILKPKFSGISMISLDYAVRLHETFSAGISSSYFILNDSDGASPISDGKNDGSLLGNEFFALLLWSPLSDLQFNLGGGVFLPSMGNAAPDADKL
jgi:hypothetical protein